MFGYYFCYIISNYGVLENAIISRCFIIFSFIFPLCSSLYTHLTPHPTTLHSRPNSPCSSLSPSLIIVYPPIVPTSPPTLFALHSVILSVHSHLILLHPRYRITIPCYCITITLLLYRYYLTSHNTFPLLYNYYPATT